MNWTKVEERMPSWEELRQLQTEGFGLVVSDGKRMCRGVVMSYPNNPPNLYCDEKTRCQMDITHWLIVKTP